MGDFFSHWHDYAYSAILIIFVILYIVHFFPSKHLGKLKALLEVQTIIMLVLIFVAVVASRIEHVAKNADERWEQAITISDKRWEQTTTILDKLQLREGFEKVKRIEKTGTYLRGLSKALDQTHNEVFATAFRPEPLDEISSHSTDAEVWIEDLDRWVNAQSGRTYKRLVGFINDDQKKWFQDACQKQVRLSSTIIRGLDLSLDHSFLNMVIFDDDEVFISLRQTEEIFEGALRYHIRGPNMTKLFKEYFLSLWNNAERCKQ